MNEDLPAIMSDMLRTLASSSSANLTAADAPGSAPTLGSWPSLLDPFIQYVACMTTDTESHWTYFLAGRQFRALEEAVLEYEHPNL
eukprot:scaffold408635_cov22-Prasinocladus_malaysianus.AAC.2